MATCRELGCNRKATHTVVVNAPTRYAEDPCCTEHAETARSHIYVKEIYRCNGGDEA